MIFYRYENRRYDIGVRIDERKFLLVKETPKGYWIKPEWDRHTDEHKRWVSKNGKNRYAYPSKKQALINFKKRKERQIEMLEWQISGARVSLNMLDYKEYKEIMEGEE